MKKVAFSKPSVAANLVGRRLVQRRPLGKLDATPPSSQKPPLRSREPPRTLSTCKTIRRRNASGRDGRQGGRQRNYSGPGVLEVSDSGAAAEEGPPLLDDGDLSQLPASAFYQILHDAQPDQVKEALLNPRFANLVASVPSTVFVEALNILSPAYFVEPYRQIHRALHPRVVQVKEFKPLTSVFAEFRDDLIDIVAARRRDGRTLGVAEYTHLLDCARAMGDEQFAAAIWADMEEARVPPDGQCYSHRMETMVWDTCFVGLEKYRLRVTHFNYRKRRWGNSEGWKGYGTGPRSVRAKVWRFFQVLLLSGHTADEACYTNLFLASARVGHVSSMKHILKTMWNVDVDALLNSDDESGIEPVTPYERSSPMYPSARLLFAVVHGFGINSQVPAALRTVEYISRSYDIPIPRSVWLELFERAFQLSRPRFGPQAIKDSKGTISPYLLRSLFDIMTAAPHNVRPTIDVYRTLAKTAWTHKTLSQYREFMNSAYDLLRETRAQEHASRLVVEQYLADLPPSDEEQQRHASATLAERPDFLDAVNTYDIHRTQAFKHRTVMDKLVRLLVVQQYWTGRDNPAWPCRIFPDMFAEWRDFLPETFVFWTGTGTIRFLGKTEWTDKHYTRDGRVPLRRDKMGNPLFEDEIKLKGQRDDGVFWERFRVRYPGLDGTLAPFRRLFWTPPPAGEGKADDVYGDERETTEGEEKFVEDTYDGEYEGLVVGDSLDRKNKRDISVQNEEEVEMEVRRDVGGRGLSRAPPKWAFLFAE